MKFQRFILFIVLCLYWTTPSGFAQKMIGGGMGSINGVGDVTDLGAFNYIMELDGPIASGGFKPDFKIVYNSQSGIGIFGQKIDFSGMSQISVTAKNEFFDGCRHPLTYTINDGLCLDGQRLILIEGVWGADGSKYQPWGNPKTEVTLHRGTTVNSGEWFEVITSDGCHSVYGKSNDSKIQIGDGTKYGAKHPIAWGVNEINDPLGNKVVYTYLKDEPRLYPAKIVYGPESGTGGTSVNVEFDYTEGLFYPRAVHISGDRKQIDKVATAITFNVDGEVSRKYEMSYSSQLGHPLLSSVQVSNQNGDVLPSTYFSWFDFNKVPDNVKPFTITSPPLHVFDTENLQLIQSADINGDGRSDLIQIMCVYPKSPPDDYVPLTYEMRVCMTDGSGNIGSAKTVGRAEALHSDRENLESYPLGCITPDVDGDGIPDIMLLLYHRTPKDLRFNWCQISLRLGKDIIANNLDNSIYYVDIFLNHNADNPIFSYADINNDGKDEVVFIEPYSEDGKVEGHYLELADSGLLANKFNFLIKPKPQSLYFADFTGNGFTDAMVFTDDHSTLYINNGVNTVEELFTSKGVYNVLLRYSKSMEMGDFNGDGLMDFLIPDETTFYIFPSNGNGTFGRTSQNSGIKATPKDGSDKYIAYDMNGDGLSDLLVLRTDPISGNKTFWLINQGDRLSLKASYDMPTNDPFGVTFTLGRFSKNGGLDLMNYGYNLCQKNQNVEKCYRLYYTANDVRVQPKRICDGLGLTSNLSFKTHIKADRSKSTDVLHCGGLPVEVVDNYYVVSGTRYVKNNRYDYGNLYYNTKGRGVVGFDEFTCTDNLKRSVTKKSVVQRDSLSYFPLEDSVITEWRDLEKKYSETKQTTYIDISGIQKNIRFVPSKEWRRDIDGIEYTTSYSYSSDGDLLWQKKEYDSPKTYKLTRFGDYRVINGMRLPATIVKEQKTISDQDAYREESSITYDSLGRKLKVVDFKNTSQPLTTDYTYDSWSNIVNIKRTAFDGEMKMQTNTYEPTGRFLTGFVRTPASTVIDFDLDKWGYLKKETDLTSLHNPIVTQYELDGWGCKTKTTFNDGTWEAYFYTRSNDDKLIFRTEAPGRYPKTIISDFAGNVLSTEEQGALGFDIKQNHSYDEWGQLVKSVYRNGFLKRDIEYSYDIFGRLRTVDDEARGVTTTYNYDGPCVERVVELPSKNMVWGNMTTHDLWGNVIMNQSLDGRIGSAFKSSGKRRAIFTEDSHISYEYDDRGRLVGQDDVSTGSQTMSYDAWGNVLEKTNAKEELTTYAYDEGKRLTGVTFEDRSIQYEYGTSGNADRKLTRISDGYNSICYSYDSFGRVDVERREFSDGTAMEFRNHYDTNGNRSVYGLPGEFAVSCTYDDGGFLTSKKVAGRTVYQLLDCSGSRTQSRHPGKHVLETYFDNAGRITENVWKDSLGTEIQSIEYCLNQNTGEVESRYGMLPGGKVEGFAYDHLDRLTSVVVDDDTVLTVNYSESGNIRYKSDIGNYNYRNSPFAVSAVTPVDSEMFESTLTTDYNSLGLIERIEDYSSGYVLDVEYGPDCRRWKSTLSRDGQIVRIIRYADEFEEIIENGKKTQFYYLDGGALTIRQYTSDTDYIERDLTIFSDHLGSIVKVFDEYGDVVFDACYDAWGNQSVITNEIGLLRGYTGHEMLPEFSLINMDGRLYDPRIARFLSPDDFIQNPSNRQTHNRYSYCLNNPLRYRDATGELFGLDDLIVGAIGFLTGYLSNGFSTGNWGWKSLLAGLTSAGGAMLGFQGANMSWLGYSASLAVCTAVGSLTPSMSQQISPHVSIGMMPLFGFGSGGFTAGLGLGLGFHFGKWDIGASIGSGGGKSGSYWGWNASAKWDGYGAGFGQTTYSPSVIMGHSIGTQRTGTISAYAGKFSLDFTNDRFGDRKDRWRTNAVELSWGDYSIGSTLLTNDGSTESEGLLPASGDMSGRDGTDPQKKALPPVGKNRNNLGSWIKGDVFHAPVWIGVRTGNMISRVGYSHKQVQNCTQNLVHKYITPTPFFSDYEQFSGGAYFFSGNVNSFNLW